MFVWQCDSLSSWFHNISPVYKECNKGVHTRVLSEQPDVRTLELRLFREKWAFVPLSQSTAITPGYISSIKLMKSCSSECFKMGPRWDGFGCRCKVPSINAPSEGHSSSKPQWHPGWWRNVTAVRMFPLLSQIELVMEKKVMENLPRSHDIKDWMY